MLQYKDTTILSELNTFFCSREKAIHTIFSLTQSLNFSKTRSFLGDKDNTIYKNVDKLIILLLFPLYEIKSGYDYKNSALYSFISCGKDVFYRLINNPFIDWRKLNYSFTKKLIKQTASKSDTNNNPTCLIVDDTDIPKTGKCIELIGKVYNHVINRHILGYKGLFLAYHDGKSLFSLDFSLHGEKGKNKKKPFGMSLAQSKKRYSKKRSKDSCGYQRVQEYNSSKITQMIKMIRRAISQGIRFDYLLVDSWFTCFELINFIRTRRIKCHLIGMIKMGNTKYNFNENMVSAKQLLDKLKRSKKVKRSKITGYYYCEAIVKIQNVQVKVFFCKSSKRAKWHGLLTTDINLSFDQAHKTYTRRWHIEVYFKESKQYLRLGKCESQDFDAQIAHTTICMLQYNIFATAKRFGEYETLGELFRQAKKDNVEATINEKIWELITELIAEMADFFETDTELIMEKIITNNQHFMKYINFEYCTKAA